MLADPISIAANAPTPALVLKVSEWKGKGSIRQDAAGVFSTQISHETVKTGKRHYLKVSETRSAIDPITGTTKMQVASASLSLSVPSFGWTAAQAVDLVELLIDIINDAEFTISNFVLEQA